jgi:myosin protein heavy chain
MANNLEEETRQKLAMNSRLRALETEREHMAEQLEEEEVRTKNLEKNLGTLSQQLAEARKKNKDECENLARLEEKHARDLEELQHKMEELQAANDKLDKSKKKLSAELDDANIELDSNRNKVVDLEKKQGNFNKILAEEKLNSERISAERDNAERDAREKETKLSNLNRDLEDHQARLYESRRTCNQLQVERDALLKSQGMVDKNVHELERAKRLLKQDLAEKKTQLEELGDKLQQTEDQKLQLEVNMNALKEQYERNLVAKEEAAEEKRRGMAKQVRQFMRLESCLQKKNSRIFNIVCGSVNISF